MTAGAGKPDPGGRSHPKPGEYHAMCTHYQNETVLDFRANGLAIVMVRGPEAFNGVRTKEGLDT